MDRPQRRAGIAHGLQGGKEPGRRQVGWPLEPGQVDDPGAPRLHQFGVIGGRALGDQVGVEVGQVIGQGPGLVGGIGVGSWVDDATAAQIGLGFQLAGHGLGRGLVGASLHRAPDAGLIGIGDVPRGTGPLAVAGSLEDTRHRFVSCQLRVGPRGR
ncbi:MAG TPA: hypothetical protein VKP69_23800, partial [Isosphaeraceae bacterium]|nr:hypothetical protein [Isosphaeraceae bacterium]